MPSQTVVILFSSDSKTEIEKAAKADELRGKLDSQFAEQKLMHSVLQNDKTVINEGKIIQEALNRGIGSFTPDLMFENVVKNYAMASQLFGETLLKLLLGYEGGFLQRNLRIPEFAREIRKKLEDKINELKEKGLINDEGFISNHGIELASIVLYVEELEELQAKGLIGAGKIKSFYGEKSEVRDFKQGDSYKAIAIRPTIKTAIKRGRAQVLESDLKSSNKTTKGKVSIIYGLDSSASMKGRKLEICKKAGIALAYKAIAQNDMVGIVSFGSTIKDCIAPTQDFSALLHSITKITASEQTDFHKAVDKTIEVFPRERVTRHLLILTDALPTSGSQPEKKTIESVSNACDAGITISVIGIQLDEKGAKFAQEIARAGKGRFFVVKDLEDLDRIVLEDYHALQA